MITDAQLDGVLAALANPVRRSIIDMVRESPGVTIAAIADRLPISGVGVLKHVRVLERAGLLISKKQGRERWLYFNTVPIRLVYERWTDEYARFWVDEMLEVKERAERGAMSGGRKAAKRA